MKKPKRRPSVHSAFRHPHSEILLGAHMSIGGGVHRAIERSRSIKCTAMQIFVKNNMQWFAPPLQRGEISAFLHHAQRAELHSAFAHANYLINLAATNPQFHVNSLRALAEELVRAVLADYPAEKVISLLAISVSHLERHTDLQLELPLGLADEGRRPGAKRGIARFGADRAVDRIRERFGWEAVGYGSVALGLSRSVPDAFRELAEKDL